MIKPRTKCKLALIDFIRPDGYWPYPCSIEQAFGLFQWMVRTGWDYKVMTRWGTRGVKEVLSGSSCVNISTVDAIRSLPDLRRRFHLALLSAHGLAGTERWRLEHQVQVDHVGWYEFPHYKPFSGPWPGGFRCEADIERALDQMLTKSDGAELNVQLNSVWAEARVVKSVAIEVSPFAFGFVLEYGFADDPGGSHWFHLLSLSQDGEPFLDTFVRARDALAAMTVDSAAERISA